MATRSANVWPRPPCPVPCRGSVPRPVEARFTDKTRRAIRVTFDSAKKVDILDKPLHTPESYPAHRPESDWLVTDANHQGYAEILAAKIKSGRVELDVAGGTFDPKKVGVHGQTLHAPLAQTGYIKPVKVSADGLSVILQLPEAAGPGAKVSYGLMSNSLATLVDEKGNTAASFDAIPVLQP